jgi:hypothetical protein
MFGNNVSLSPSLPLSLHSHLHTYANKPTHLQMLFRQCGRAVPWKINVVQTLISSKSKSNNQMLFELILTEAKSNFHNYVSKFRKVLKVIHPFLKIFIIIDYICKLVNWFLTATSFIRLHLSIIATHSDTFTDRQVMQLKTSFGFVYGTN